MGRINPKYNNPLYKRTRSTARRVVKSSISVGQALHRVPGEAFYACIRIGRHTECGYGKNPRAAMVGALRKAADVVQKRKGAFAGLKKGGR